MAFIPSKGRLSTLFTFHNHCYNELLCTDLLVSVQEFLGSLEEQFQFAFLTETWEFLFFDNFFPLGFVKVLTLANPIGTQCCFDHKFNLHFLSWGGLFCWLLVSSFVGIVLCCLLIWELSYLSFLLEYFYILWTPIFLLSLGSLTKNELIFRMILAPLPFIFYLFLFICSICSLIISYTYLVHHSCFLSSLLLPLCQHSPLPTGLLPIHSFLFCFVLWLSDFTRVICVATEKYHGTNLNPKY